MRLIDDVAQDAATDPAILMRRLDLQLANFDEARVIQNLDHTDALSVDFDDGDVAAFPALAGVANVTCLVPTAEGRDEQVSIDTPPQLIEPTLVVLRHAKQAIAQAVTDAEWLSHDAPVQRRRASGCRATICCNAQLYGSPLSNADIVVLLLDSLQPLTAENHAVSWRSRCAN